MAAKAELAREALGGWKALFQTRTGRCLRAFGIGAVALLAVSLVVRQARAAVHRMPAYRIGPESVKFVDLPALVDERMGTYLGDWIPYLWPKEATSFPTTYDTGLERKLKELLAAHPMIRSVGDVEVRFPGEVRVRADVRTPLARFNARVGAYKDGSPAWNQVPVDEEGVVLLPDAYGPFLDRYRAILVSGVEAICPDVGRRWTDTKAQVAEGLAAARVANRLNAELLTFASVRIEAADVSGFPASPRTRVRGEVVLRLSDGRRVQWGRTERDLSDVTREDGYETKKDRLMDLLRSRPSGDRRDLDVRFPSGSHAVVPRDV